MKEAENRPVILAVDDDATNLRLLGEILKHDYQPYLAPSGQRALRFLEKNHPNLIILDLEMPDMDGYEVIRRIKSNAAWSDIPVIFLTGIEGRDKEKVALDLGAVDYILKPISAEIVKARASLHIELGNYRRGLEKMVDVRTAQLHRTQDVILDMLANVTSVRDNQTGAHLKRTTSYVEALIEALLQKKHPQYQIDEQYAQSIIKSAKLHDIGKVAVPDHILLKPTRLTTLEFEMIKQHAVYGARILELAIAELEDESYFLSVAREIVVSHHEKWDGTGYPNGLKGLEIPLSGRLMAIADAYDAMISNRPYKTGQSHQKAVDTILKDAGTHFDPTLVTLCNDALDRFREIALLHRDDPHEIVFE